MSDGSDEETENLDEGTLSKILSDLNEIKSQLNDLTNIKNRLVTLEQIQMKIISGEIIVGQDKKSQAPPPVEETSDQKVKKKEDFEVVGYSSERDQEKIFTFPDSETGTDEYEQPRESDDYDYELDDLPEVIPVEAEPVQDSEFDDLEYGCPFCGATVGAFATVCPGCGRELEEEEDIVERSQSDPPSQHQTLENYYRAQNTGKYTKNQREEYNSYYQPGSGYSESRNRPVVEVEPLKEPAPLPEVQLSSYARGEHTDSPPTCEFCDKPTRYIKEYGRWYCYSCNKYSKSRAKPVEVPVHKSRGTGQGSKPLKDYPRYSK
jgi:hypothetical protein